MEDIEERCNEAVKNNKSLEANLQDLSDELNKAKDNNIESKVKIEDLNREKMDLAKDKKVLENKIGLLSEDNVKATDCITKLKTELRGKEMKEIKVNKGIKKQINDVRTDIDKNIPKERVISGS